MYKYRGLITAILGLLLLLLPPAGFELFCCALAVFLFIAAFFLRVWARMYIGEHTRGSELSCPKFASIGPYRYIKHPIYLSNFMAGAAFALFHAGFSVAALGFCAIYGFFLATLAMKENNFLKKEGKATPHHMPHIQNPLKSAMNDFPTWFWQIAMLILIFLRKNLDNADFFYYILSPYF
ncbi:MAG: hypothetical protein LBH25_06920 [Fibromonadaceae bacterium]|nr:hypothetical protein [Fibromonadaceae bacterium]